MGGKGMNWKKVAAYTLAVSMITTQFTGMGGAFSIGQVKAAVTSEGVNSTNTEYQKEFSQSGLEGLKLAKGTANFSLQEGKLRIESKKGEASILIDENAPEFQNGEVEFTFDPLNDNQGGRYGIVLRYTKDGAYTFIGQEGHSAKDPYLTSWVMQTSDGKNQLLLTDGQRIYAGREKPYTLKVRIIENAVTLYLDNVMIFSGEVDGVTQGSGKVGLYYFNESGAEITNIKVNPVEALKVKSANENQKQIANTQLRVTMDADYPRVIEYQQVKTGKKLYGQEEPIYAVELNNTRYVPAVTSEFKSGKAVYHLTIKELGASFDVVYTLKGNVLRMELMNIKEGSEPIKTIHFPNQSIVSMRSTQPNAKLRVNNYRKETIYDLSKTYTQRAYQTTSLAVLSCDDIAASINNGNINNRQEIGYQTVKQGDYYSTGLFTNEFQYKGLDDVPIDALWTEVAITGDRNGDEKIDYQDGAIARRDDIGSNRLGTETTQNSMSMIAMDVGSAVQYPFLRILDNIKKFHAATDGFEQMILIKGYQSEGHDASHPDFANISERAGGLEDFKVLLNEAGKYGAKIGLHINHTEAYPEAKQYSESLISDTLGWTWYDDSYHIIRENDILDKENGLEKRLDDLAALTDGKLSMIYVDTYQDSRWQADKIAKKITDLGWMLGTEYSEELIKYSTWSHTINSSNFDYNTQGNLVRFIDNQNKDIFGNSPLFRGYTNRNTNAGFFGWQECKSFDATIENFFTKILPQKYLANFPVSQWPEKDKVILGRNNEVVTELVDGVNRISQNGKAVAIGNQIFIPWKSEEEIKIYHWNEEGGSSTWELPDSFSNLETVKLYTLTDEGRTNETILTVKDNTVTINAKPKTGYVIYKGTSAVKETDMTAYDFGAKSVVKDMGFDSHTFGFAWNKSSTASNTDHITFRNNATENTAEKDSADNNKGNTHIHVEGGSDAVLTQTMEGLVPGQTYSASVFAEGSEGRKLGISITTPDGKTVSNYADDFTVAYGVPHNDRFGTYYQRVKVTFTQPLGGTTAKIELTAEKENEKEAWANFDNVRVTKVGISDTKGHTFYEDFENVDQEFGPFVCPTKVTQSHLSESNGDWTKDVISGRYSLKIRGNGSTTQKFNYMRTVSHRIRLLPNTTYTIGMDYMITDVEANKDIFAGSTAFVVGVKSDKAAAAKDTKNAVLVQVPCTAKDSKVQNLKEITFTTGSYDDYYIDFLDETYAHEFIIDNFYVDKK